MGHISMVAASAVLHAMGETTALLPTTLLSTQTEGFGRPARLDLSAWAQDALTHWQANDVHFSGAIIGYLGSRVAVDRVGRLLSSLPDLQQVIIDPAMADQGRLYPGLPSDYPAAVRRLCRAARLITPNWTELCMLAGQPQLTPNRANLQLAVNRLRAAGISATVIVTGVVRPPKIDCWTVASGHLLENSFNYFPGHFYGTGDAFTALLYVFLKQRDDLSWAIDQTGSALLIAIKATSQLAEDDRRFGLRLPELLAYLLQKGR